MYEKKQHQNTPALEITGLNKSYGPVRALRGINLVVGKGEIFGFLGPNGAGKTTTIRCLLDTIRPQSGTIRLFGKDPQTEPIAVQQQVGYLPGEVQFFDNFTAERQLRFFSDMRGREADWRFTQELAERLDLDLKKQIKNMSKGNKQKIGVVQALMHRPAFLLLDEPTSGLDPLMQQIVLDLLREANMKGTTVFFSSHIMSEVEHVAERVAIIRRGQIIEVAETARLMDRALNRMTVRFKEPVDCSKLEQLNGVEILSRFDGTSLTLKVAGDMEELIHTLGSYPVQDLDTARPSLEEIFLEYYAPDGRDA